MARVSTYLNFKGTTEEAFTFYKSVFGTEFIGEINRYGDIPPSEDMPPMSDEVKQRVMHVALPILAGHVIMGTDAVEGMGHPFSAGNNVYLNLEPDTREETDRLYAALSEGGEIEMPLQEMFWGDYYAAFTDRFGTKWMLNCASKS